MPYHGMGVTSQQGDPFIHKKIFGGLGKLARFGSKFAPGPFGTALGAAGGVFGRLAGRRGRMGRQTFLTPPPQFPGFPKGRDPSFAGTRKQFGVGEFKPKPKRINPANPKALRRAIRRTSGFVKLAKRALKGTGFKIVSSGSRSRKDIPPGHAHVR